jgi:hypothetical protein
MPHTPSLQVTFREATEGPDRNQEYVFTRVKCFPLFSLLLAINTTAFNYLSLDAEGAEIQVPKFAGLKFTQVHWLFVTANTLNMSNPNLN